MTIYIVTDNNCTDGECGYIIGVTSSYDRAAFLKRDYIALAEIAYWEQKAKFPHVYQPFAMRYPHNIEILEKELQS